MKEGIHPDYVETSVTCGCGTSFTTRGTRSELKIDICSECHPVLHWEAEVRGRGRTHRKVQEQICCWFLRNEEVALIESGVVTFLTCH